MNIPVCKDVLQEVSGKLSIPEIRVWCHPKNGGSDFYHIFDSFGEALRFISTHKDEAEEYPLIAYNGYEFNIFRIE